MTLDEYKDLIVRLAHDVVAENEADIKKYVCTIFSHSSDMERVVIKLCEVVCGDRLLGLAHREMFGDIIGLATEMDGAKDYRARSCAKFLHIPEVQQFWSHHPSTNLTHYLIIKAIKDAVSNAKEEGDDGK